MSDRVDKPNSSEEDAQHRRNPVRAARGPRYGRGYKPGSLPRASESDDPIYRRVPVAADGMSLETRPRSMLHSLLTSLPILMLLAGLWVFYRNEGAQTEAGPLRDASVQWEGVYLGVSQVRAAGTGRHYLWLLPAAEGASPELAADSERRGFRVLLEQAALLRQQLAVDTRVVVDAAPTVEGSQTLWLWRLSVDGEIIIDDTERLR